MIRFSIRRPFRLALNVIGIVLVGLDFTNRALADAPVPMAFAGWGAWGLWIVATFFPERYQRTRTVLYLLMLAGASLVSAATDITGFVPGIVALLFIGGNPQVPIRLVAGAVAGSVTLVGLAAVLDPVPWSEVISELSTLLVAALGGLSRRQHQSAEEQSRALLEERIAVEQERALNARLSERSRIARDLHDVLAHSLGGLVIQLEAVDALLESGRDGAARERVIAARQLAVSGLDEAKQAVTALREPAEEFGAAMNDLVASHRALRGEVVVRGRTDQGGLSADGRTALRRAVQELLTNGRRHAPGVTTTLDLDWGPELLTVTATTPAPPAGAVRGTSGGGHGLTGMRERVAEAGGTMTVRAGPPFEVVLRLPREKRDV